MFNRNYIAPPESWWVMLFAIVCRLTLTDWGSIAAIVAAFVAVALVLRAIIRYIKHKHPFKAFHYLIPKREWEYLGKRYDDAPDKEVQPDKLTVNVGKYELLCILVTKDNLDIRYRYPPIFEGQQDSKPKVVNPVRYRPISIGRDDFRIFSYRIETYGSWKGKAMFEFYVEDVGKVRKRLDFCVSTNEDEVPFLKVINNQTKTKN
jgi:hypothetical protein